MKIWDCRHKETLEIERKGGDLAIIFKNEKGEKIQEFWFQMKKPYKRTFGMLESSFKVIKYYLERQEEEFEWKPDKSQILTIEESLEKNKRRKNA